MSPLIALLFVGVFHTALLMAHGTYIAFAHGVAWGTGRRDQPVSATDLGRRFDRAVTNNVESLAAFVPITVAVVLFKISNDMTELATFAFIFARLAFVGLYLFNVPYIRTFFWLVGQGAILFLAAAIMMEIPLHI